MAFSHSFASVYELQVPTNDPAKDGIFISNSYDATSHFETVCDDVKRLYAQINGHPLDYSGKIKRADAEEGDAELQSGAE
jgi:Rab GDP dissociation inhibitor